MANCHASGSVIGTIDIAQSQVLSAPPLNRPTHTEMEATRNEIVHGKARRKQVWTSATVAKFLKDCGQLLTDVEYSRINDKSKAESEFVVDELFEIILCKDDEDFATICSALRLDGYEELVARLKEEAMTRKGSNVVPSDHELLVKVEHAWNEPTKAESSPTNRFSDGIEEHSQDRGACLESLPSNLGV